jgi:hypothetical protein
VNGTRVHQPSVQEAAIFRVKVEELELTVFGLDTEMAPGDPLIVNGHSAGGVAPDLKRRFKRKP